MISQVSTNDIAEGIAADSLDLLDVQNLVREFLTTVSLIDIQLSVQDNRLLLVISNFGHLSRIVLPSLLTELESAFGASVQDDKQVPVS